MLKTTTNSLGNWIVGYPKQTRTVAARVLLLLCLLGPAQFGAAQSDAQQARTENQIDHLQASLSKLMSRIDAETQRAKADTKLLRVQFQGEAKLQNKRLEDLEVGRAALNGYALSGAGVLVLILIAVAAFFTKRVISGQDRLLARLYELSK